MSSKDSSSSSQYYINPASEGRAKDSAVQAYARVPKEAKSLAISNYADKEAFSNFGSKSPNFMSNVIDKYFESLHAIMEAEMLSLRRQRELERKRI